MDASLGRLYDHERSLQRGTFRPPFPPEEPTIRLDPETLFAPDFSRPRQETVFTNVLSSGAAKLDQMPRIPQEREGKDDLYKGRRI